MVRALDEWLDKGFPTNRTIIKIIVIALLCAITIYVNGIIAPVVYAEILKKMGFTQDTGLFSRSSGKYALLFLGMILIGVITEIICIFTDNHK